MEGFAWWLKAEASLHTPKRFAQIRPLNAQIAVNGRDEQSFLSSPGLPAFGIKRCDEPIDLNPAVVAHGTLGTHRNRRQEVSCPTHPLGETLFEISSRLFRVFRVFRGLQLPDLGSSLGHRSAPKQAGSSSAMARGIGASDIKGGDSKPPSLPHSKSLARVRKARPQSMPAKALQSFRKDSPGHRLSQGIGMSSCMLIQLI